MKLTNLLPLVVKREPIIDTGTRGAQGRCLDVHLTDLIITFRAFVPDYDYHVITDILDIDIKCFVPLWVLAILCRSLELLLSILYRDEGVHTSEGRCISREASLDDLEVKGSGSCHKSVTLFKFLF